MNSASPTDPSYFNRGPLTTTFTPPTTCLQTLSEVSFAVGSTIQSTTFFGHWFGDYTGYTCLPTGTVPGTLLASPSYWNTYWYSPGIYCPTGWTTAGQLSGSWNGLDVTGSTSGAICCPTSMNFYSQNHECRQIISAKETITLSTTGVVIESTLATPITIYADGIPLIWEKSDLPETTSSPSTSPSTTSSSTTSSSKTPLSGHTSTAASETAANSSNSSNNNKSGGLSEGAKIGIGIAIPLAAIAIGAAIFFYFLKRHKKTQRVELDDPPPNFPRSHETPRELATKENFAPSELASRGDRSELPPNTATVVNELA